MNNKCSVENCDNEILNKPHQLCSKHYQRLRRLGDVNGVSNHLSRTEEERFLEKVEKTDFCWLWTGAVELNGYGRFSAGGRMHTAHKYSYEKYKDIVPEGMVVDHQYGDQGCVRNCVNPDHLRIATYSENAQNFKGTKKNNTSGHRNVSWVPAHSRWLVRVVKKGKPIHGGVFPLYELHVAGYRARQLRAEHFDIPAE